MRSFIRTFFSLLVHMLVKGNITSFFMETMEIFFTAILKSTLMSMKTEVIKTKEILNLFSTIMVSNNLSRGNAQYAVVVVNKQKNVLFRTAVCFGFD